MSAPPHIPVLLTALMERAAPVAGHWVDMTFGAGGYSHALLQAGAGRVTAVDRDPAAAGFAAGFPDCFTLLYDRFSNIAHHVTDVDGVVMDLGVSSMQLDGAERGFSFLRDGPLDMRMGQTGGTAADIVNTATESTLADILYLYGEERAARRIAKAIVKRRAEAAFATTLDLADVIAGQLPRPKPGQTHPATRSFQALRIAVNGEYTELALGLAAAEKVLKPNGILAVVTFHSVEDRIVKRFLHRRFGTRQGSRYAPEVTDTPGQFIPITRKSITPNAAERAVNPRARSAKLRMARRTDAAPAVGDVMQDIPVVKGYMA